MEICANNFCHVLVYVAAWKQVMHCSENLKKENKSKESALASTLCAAKVVKVCKRPGDLELCMVSDQ